VRPRGAVVITLLAVLLTSALYPIRQYVGQKSRVRALAAEQAELSVRIADLRVQQGLLLSDDEIERIAREQLGMVRPGEVAFAVLPDAQKRAAAAAPTAQKAPTAGAEDRESWHQRWWDAVVDTFTGIR
jgi:cell division protein FtsB